MKKASKLFYEKQIKAIESQIAMIEQKTTAEIVPVIATKSSNYDDVAGLFSFAFSLFILTLYWLFLQFSPASNAMWQEGFVLSFNLLSTLIVLIISYFVGNKVVLYLFGVKRLLLNQNRINKEVQANAKMAFQRFRVMNTKDSVGVLVYVSLFEPYGSCAS